MLQIKSLSKAIYNSKWFVPVFFLIWLILFVGLALLRDSRLDENIYFGETTLITDLLRSGEWVGNYGVGLHGFLNKFLVALIFFFTGPSVFIATLSNVVLGLLSGVVLYKIATKHFKFSKISALLGVTLLFSSYQFMMYIPTYYRDIGSLLFTLLVIESILSKRGKYLTGLLLLLLLDFKEHVFYTVGFAVLIWLVYEAYTVHRGNIWLMLKYFVISGLQIYLPSLLYLILMFATPLLPLNSYNANIFGLVETGFDKMAKSFYVSVATYNQDVQFNKSVAKMMPLIPIPDGASVLWSSVIAGINVILSYIGKILYPRTFSYLSVPFVILIPALYMSVKKFGEWSKKGLRERGVLYILLTIYLFIYVLRASLGRYLLPVSPFIYLFFLLFLKEKHSKKEVLWVLGLSALLSAGELYFEYSYIPVKILFVLIPLLLIFTISRIKDVKRHITTFILVTLLSIFSAGTSLLVSYNNGQIGTFLKYGYNRECEKIIEMVDLEDKIWINDIYWDRLPFTLRYEDVTDPEWRWQLRSWIPKEDMLVRKEGLKTYNFEWKEIDMFRANIEEKGINKVVFVKLDILNPEERIKLQDKFEDVLHAEWLTLRESKELKNKTVYIFEVNGNVYSR